MANNEQHCSFCGKAKLDTKMLIAGPDGVAICDECVEICKSMLEDTNDTVKTEEVPLKKSQAGKSGHVPSL